MQLEGRPQRSHGQLAHAQSPHQRVAFEAVDQCSSADDDPRLRTAQQLVAAEEHEVRAGADRSARVGLVIGKAGKALPIEQP